MWLLDLRREQDPKIASKVLIMWHVTYFSQREVWCVANITVTAVFTFQTLTKFEFDLCNNYNR